MDRLIERYACKDVYIGQERMRCHTCNNLFFDADRLEVNEVYVGYNDSILHSKIHQVLITTCFYCGNKQTFKDNGNIRIGDE